MNLNEQKLFFELCKFKSYDGDMIRYLIENESVAPLLLGHLHINRVASVAYDVLNQSDNLHFLNREVANSLKDAYTISKEKNNSYFECIDIVNNALNGINTNSAKKYVLLKGAYLCGKYPIGYRTSNDIDILVPTEYITEIGSALTNAGFVQGYIKGGEFSPASRWEIITSRIMRGETVPYVKRIDLPYIKYLEVDINFSLDYKNSETDIINRLITNSVKKHSGYNDIYTLDAYDFIIHLCVHLFKEATTLPWVKMGRDMTFYKYLDIYYLLNEFDVTDSLMLVSRICEYKLWDPCYYAIKSVKEFFGDNTNVYDCILSHAELTDNNVMEHVIDPENNKVLTYTETDVKERLFNNNRLGLLEV